MNKILILKKVLCFKFPSYANRSIHEIGKGFGTYVKMSTRNNQSCKRHIQKTIHCDIITNFKKYSNVIDPCT